MPSQYSQWFTKIRKFVVKWLTKLWKSFKFLGGLCKQAFLAAIAFFKQRPSIVVAFVFLLFFGSIAMSALINVPHQFEASLIVKELSFNTQKQNQLLLNSLYEISELAIQGQQTLTLQGKFANEKIPQLDRIDTLTIELNNQQSLWKIAPSDRNTPSEIEILELRLNHLTTVEGLNYNPFNNNKLAFSLQPANSNESSDRPNEIDLYLGTQPLILTLEGYQLKNLELPPEINPSQPLELTFTPDIPEIQLNLPETTFFSANLPNLEQIDGTNWFWGNLAVKDTQLYTLERTGSEIADELYRSTIVEGKIRMAQQELTLEPQQFFLIDPPGIEKIRAIQIQEKGLEVRVSGTTHQIKVGLDPDFPISTIQSNWIARHFPREIVIAIITFCTGMTASLLTWLVQNIFKTSQT
ncbi:hypothetical protein [Spirulina sp. 06S082]|uniref:hypothetical protein n=1 Tax=Spirulina sp. 06S082 TaxID=3110248 RepID=UPI002B1F51F7|nr:hypothetical protein [Spirulina sp. 06S082]MEA5469753.1 hypothetical protein [Spirulina sp. 06S082]